MKDRIQNELESANKQANLYRTKWLIAHNTLHALVHEENQEIQNKDGAKKYFTEYLCELENAPKIALLPA